ncbi:MAG: pyridoxal phosphate-dependent aminotransferase [Bacteroidota bacterium]
MPHLSQRASFIPASPIRKLAPYAEAAKAAGKHIYHLNIGQPDLETPKTYWEAIRQGESKVLAYGSSAGEKPLRLAISDYYKRIGIEMPADHILITTGASEALNFIFSVCLDPGDQIIVPEPFYANYHSYAAFMYTQVQPIGTDIDNHFALPPVEAFEAAIQPRTKAIMICNPNNPTGVMYGKEELEGLLALAKKYGLYLIADEVYREFSYADFPHHSCLQLEGGEEHVIVIDSISKRFSACGARVGCLLTHNQEILDAVLRLAQSRLCPPTLGQIGAEALYRLPVSYFEEVSAEYLKRRNTLVSLLRDIPGVMVPEVNGAFYAMVKLPVENSEDFCRWMLEEFSYENSTVMMAPGSGFYINPRKGKNEVRIAYVLKEEDLKKAIKCLAEGLRAYESRNKAHIPA